MVTCPEERYRRAELAIQAAQHALKLAQTKEVAYRDTLAAAYANAGQFDEAVDTLAKLIQSVEDEPTLITLKKRLERYRNGKPYRQGRVEAE